MEVSYLEDCAAGGAKGLPVRAMPLWIKLVFSVLGAAVVGGGWYLGRLEDSIGSYDRAATMRALQDLEQRERDLQARARSPDNGWLQIQDLFVQVPPCMEFGKNEWREIISGGRSWDKEIDAFSRDFAPWYVRVRQAVQAPVFLDEAAWESPDTRENRTDVYEKLSDSLALLGAHYLEQHRYQDAVEAFLTGERLGLACTRQPPYEVYRWAEAPRVRLDVQIGFLRALRCIRLLPPHASRGPLRAAVAGLSRLATGPADLVQTADHRLYSTLQVYRALENGSPAGSRYIDSPARNPWSRLLLARDRQAATWQYFEMRDALIGAYRTSLNRSSEQYRREFQWWHSRSDVDYRVVDLLCRWDCSRELSLFWLAEANRRGLLLLAALHAYAADHRHYPARLDDLVPTYLAAVPDDPFSAHAPFRYRLRGANDFLLYSVGFDGVDDGGKPVWGNYLVNVDFNSSGDIVYSELR